MHLIACTCTRKRTQTGKGSWCRASGLQLPHNVTKSASVLFISEGELVSVCVSSLFILFKALYRRGVNNLLFTFGVFCVYVGKTVPIHAVYTHHADILNVSECNCLSNFLFLRLMEKLIYYSLTLCLKLN